MNKRTMIAVVIAALGFSSSAGAALLVYEGFDYGTQTDLDGRNGGQGFSNAWSVTAGSMALSGDDTSLDSGAYPFAPVGARLSNPSNGGTDIAERSFDSSAYMDLSAEGDVYYYSALLRKSQTNEASEYIQVRLVDNAGNERGSFGFTSDDQFTMQTAAGGTVEAATTYFMVCKIVTHSGATPDEFYLKAYKPDDTVDASEPATWTVTTTSATGVELTRMRVYTGANGTMDMDEFRTGTTWESVAIPEPGSVLLFLGAAALLATGRRSRRTRASS